MLLLGRRSIAIPNSVRISCGSRRNTTVDTKHWFCTRTSAMPQRQVSKRPEFGACYVTRGLGGTRQRTSQSSFKGWNATRSRTRAFHSTQKGTVVEANRARSQPAKSFRSGSCSKCRGWCFGMCELRVVLVFVCVVWCYVWCLPSRLVLCRHDGTPASRERSCNARLCATTGRLLSACMVKTRMRARPMA